jgi:hypothetical protein
MIVNYLMYLMYLMDLQIIKSKYRRARLRKSPARLAGLTGLAGKGGGGLAFECLRQASFAEGASARTVFMPVDILFLRTLVGDAVLAMTRCSGSKTVNICWGEMLV